jgi:uncharacterized membrane protein YfcA
MTAIVLYLCVGAISGVLAGLLGIGGGLIIVPALAYLLTDIPDNLVMHVAVGTSLAVVTVTSMSSTRSHHQRGTVRWDLWRSLSPGLVIGTLAGAYVADQLPGSALKIFFAVFELLVALYLAFGAQATPAAKTPHFAVTLVAAFFIGIVCAFAGVGGGIMIVPLLTWLRLPIKEAVSTSAACGLPIAASGTIGFMVVGLNTAQQLPVWSTGYIYWPAFFGLMVTSVLFAPLGAKIAHALPSQVLRRIFAIFLMALAVLMYIKNIG